MIDREVMRRQTVASGQPWIEVSVSEKKLWLREGEHVLRQYPVATARNGVGEINGSGCTPRGWHVIRARIGEGLPSGAVLVGRRPTGEIYTAELGRRYPERDWILTRILWLSGCEPGFNRLGNRDTMRRFVYIHGCPDEAPMGVDRTAGCINMRNQDVIELFSLVPAGTRVLIQE